MPDSKKDGLFKITIVTRAGQNRTDHGIFSGLFDYV